jgi:hypothetical protein
MYVEMRVAPDISDLGGKKLGASSRLPADSIARPKKKAKSGEDESSLKTSASTTHNIPEDMEELMH